MDRLKPKFSLDNDPLNKWKKSNKWIDLKYIISHWTRILVKSWNNKVLELTS